MNLPALLPLPEPVREPHPQWLDVPSAPGVQAAWQALRHPVPRRARLLHLCAHPIPCEVPDVGIDPLDGLDLPEPARRRICFDHEFLDLAAVVDPALWPSRHPGSRRWDKHELDVLLSAGRHAAERARLAGCSLLILSVAERMQESLHGAVDWSAMSVQQGYEWLAYCANAPLIATCGACIAAGQMSMLAWKQGEPDSCLGSSEFPQFGLTKETRRRPR